MSEIYGFKEQLRIGKEGEAKLDKFFKEVIGFTIEPVTKEEEIASGFDRKFIKDDRQCYIEYKTDDKAKTTGNLFIETLSNSNNGKLGWVLTSKADRVTILVGSIAYLIKMKELRKHIQTKGNQYRIATAHNPTYVSKGRLLPIKDLNKIKGVKIYDISGVL